MVATPDPLQRNHVTVRGAADAVRTMVFVHGFGTDQSSWKDVSSAFEPTWRVVLLDHAGTTCASRNEATPPQHRYLNLQGYADDLIEVADALHLQHVVLVGHSFGAVVCALAAIGRATLCDQLVMLGASPRFLDDGAYHGGFTMTDLDAVYRLVALGSTNLAQQMAPQALGPGKRPDLARVFVDTIQAIPQERLLTLLCAIFQGDHRAELSRLHVPTLLLQTHQDAFVPAAVAHYLQEHIASSELVWLDAEGHLPHLSAPALVINAIRDFVDRPVPQPLVVATH